MTSGSYDDDAEVKDAMAAIRNRRKGALVQLKAAARVAIEDMDANALRNPQALEALLQVAGLADDPDTDKLIATKYGNRTTRPVGGSVSDEVLVFTPDGQFSGTTITLQQAKSNPGRYVQSQFVEVNGVARPAVKDLEFGTPHAAAPTNIPGQVVGQSQVPIWGGPPRPAVAAAPAPAPAPKPLDKLPVYLADGVTPSREPKLTFPEAEAKGYVALPDTDDPNLVGGFRHLRPGESGPKVKSRGIWPFRSNS